MLRVHDNTNMEIHFQNLNSCMENLGSYLLHAAPVQESFFVCVKRGDLRYLTELLTKDPEAINAREEVGLHHREKDRRRGSFLPVCVCVCVLYRQGRRCYTMPAPWASLKSSSIF